MRCKQCIDKDWKFFLGDLSPKDPAEEWGGAKARAYSFGAAAENFDDSNWRSVDIPHDFVSEGDYTRKNNVNTSITKIPEMESIDSRHFAGGSLEGGVVWYRKRFQTSAECADKRVYLCFDGVYRKSDVYLNEYFIGHHESGYTSFYYDITDFINIGGENLLAVRVNSIGREGWWYEGGGIYRHVWLEITNSVHVEKWGTFVKSRVNLEDGSAELTIKTEIANRLTRGESITVKSQVLDANSTSVAVCESEMSVPAWENAICTQNTFIDKALLWDLENPHMYKLKTTLSVCGKDVDEYMIDFGIRDVRFDADKGLFLNGKNVKVKGLCVHQDHAGVGIAADESLWNYRVDRMKSMGANGCRSAHHPPLPELLDICDRKGMLVLDETRRMSSCREDTEQLRLLIKRDRNHPSIFLWGIGNEEIFSQHRPETARTTVSMKMEIEKLDGTRPVTAAVVCWDGKQRFEHARNHMHVTKNLDIMGFNYCLTAWDDYHEQMPEQPVIITEASANSWTRGCYSTDEKRGQYYIYDSENIKKCKNGKKANRKDLAETEWKYFAEREYLAGIFLWTGMDYRGEPTPLAYPAVYSQFGIFDYCGFEKDNYYYYKSWWSDEDVLHLLPHWNLCTGETTDVYCYSNFDEVELFVNAKSCGRKRMEKNWYLCWENIAFEAGEISAKGYRDGVEVMSETVRTAGAAYALALAPYKTEIESGATAIINVSIVDKNGNNVPYADNEIRFEVEGAGKFLGTGNGNPASHESEKIPVRRAFNGLCQLLARAEKTGEMTVTARAEGLESAKCVVKVK